MYTTFIRNEDGEVSPPWFCTLAGWSKTYVTFPVIWALSAAMSVPPLLGWSNFIPESAGIR